MSENYLSVFGEYAKSMQFLVKMVNDFTDRLKRAYYIQRAIADNLIQVKKHDENSVEIQVVYNKYLIYFDIPFSKPEIQLVRDLKPIAEISFMKFNLDRSDDQPQLTRFGECVYLAANYVLFDREGNTIEPDITSHELQIFKRLAYEIVKERKLLEQES